MSTLGQLGENLQWEDAVQLFMSQHLRGWVAARWMDSNILDFRLDGLSSKGTDLTDRSSRVNASRISDPDFAADAQRGIQPDEFFFNKLVSVCSRCQEHEVVGLRPATSPHWCQRSRDASLHPKLVRSGSRALIISVQGGVNCTCGLGSKLERDTEDKPLPS